MNRFFIVSLLVLSTTFSIGQVQIESAPTPFNTKNSSLTTQFNFLMEQSRTYVNNKVVKIDWLNKFHSNSTDSIKDLRAENKNLIESYQKEKNRAESALEKLSLKEAELTSVQLDKDSITMFGSPTTKGSYKSIMWTIIIIITALLLFLTFKFKSSNSTTKETKERLANIEDELDSTKKKFRLKEQEIMRKLQDEINKNL